MNGHINAALIFIDRALEDLKHGGVEGCIDESIEDIKAAKKELLELIKSSSWK
jgi:hypothetical protein